MTEPWVVVSILLFGTFTLVLVTVLIWSAFKFIVLVGLPAVREIIDMRKALENGNTAEQQQLDILRQQNEVLAQIKNVATSSDINASATKVSIQEHDEAAEARHAVQVAQLAEITQRQKDDGEKLDRILILFNAFNEDFGKRLDNLPAQVAAPLRAATERMLREMKQAVGPPAQETAENSAAKAAQEKNEK